VKEGTNIEDAFNLLGKNICANQSLVKSGIDSKQGIKIKPVIKDKKKFCC